MVAPELEIIITAGADEVLRRTLRPGEYVIGSADTADLRVTVPEVAGRHALLTVNFDHTLIEALDGSAAVLINGQFLRQQKYAFSSAATAP